MSKIDLGMDFQMPKNQSSQIKVMGIGGILAAQDI